jgi:arylsulfatase
LPGEISFYRSAPDHLQLIIMIRSALTSFAFATLTALASAAQKPNILIVLADDLGFSDLSSYGSEIQTPNIDALATGGTKFSSFYNSARCCPSRASLITGLHPHEAGIGSFTTARPQKGWGAAYTGHLLPEAATLPEILGQGGYSTWMVGKWHLGNPGPIKRGFQNYYGYKNLLSHSESQWDPEQYIRLPQGTKPELSYADNKFYVTDVFTDYALEFLKQARQTKDKPWFLFLSHSSPHFPIQAPKEDIDKNMATYRKGWDVLRAERFERQKKLGLIPADAKLPPLSEVPVEPQAIANGFSGVPNPKWETLPADRREDLARRMATYAAMVQHVDQSVGKVVADLKANGEFENTLIFFMSDNGACYEWGPFGFDGPSRAGTTTLHTGAALDKIGQAGTHSSYGSGWANLGNTPLNMFKHFCHEGGISSPLIIQWPTSIKPRAGWIETPVHIMDITPTACAAAGVKAPEKLGVHSVLPFSGRSLLPACANGSMEDRPIATEHQEARGYRLGDWKIVWGKRQKDPIHWELYNLKIDRSEQHDLSAERPEIVAKLVKGWTDWAKKVGVHLEERANGEVGPD